MRNQGSEKLTCPKAHDLEGQCWDMNPGLPDPKSVRLTTTPHCLPGHHQLQALLQDQQLLSWQPARLCLWDSLGKNTGVGSHSLLQGIFLIQGSNLGLLHCRPVLYPLSLSLANAWLIFISSFHQNIPWFIYLIKAITFIFN